MLFCLTGGKMPSRRCKFALCVGKVPWRNKWQSTLIACLGNPIDRRASGATVHGVTTESDRLETKQQIIVQFCVSFCCTIMRISQVCLCVKSSRHVQFFATLQIAACQVPLSMGFCRQEHWSGLSCTSPGDLPDPGIEPGSLMSPALAGWFLTTSATWEALKSATSMHISYLLFILHEKLA